MARERGSAKKPSARRKAAAAAEPHAGPMQESLLRKLFSAVEQIDESVVITDREGTIEYVNPAFQRTTGYRWQEVVGKTPRILKSGRHEPAFYEQLWRSLLSGESFHGVVVNRRKDGSLYHEEKTITPVRDESGSIRYFVSTGTDVTRRRLAEEKLLQGTESFVLSIRGANDGLWDWDFRTGKLSLSSRWKSMLGFSDDEVGETIDHWFRLVHPEDLPSLKSRMKSHLDGTASHFEHEHRMLCKSGGYLWVLTRGLAVRDEEGRAYRVAGSQTEITGRKLAQEQLQHDALHDPLTGLPNRTLFLDRLGQSMARANRRADCFFAVLFVDLDRFKVVNDSLGHLAGDGLLMEVANRLLRCLRSSDTVARLGGDEFAILLDGISDPPTASRFASRLLERLGEPFVVAGREVFTTASIGMAFHGEAYRRPEEIIRDADTAMYAAKHRGRNQLVVFDATMHSKVVRQLELETELRRAVADNGLSVHYQPIVSLSDRRVAGFEALLRWFHPERGIIHPAEFIPLAEDSGLIEPVGRFALREACRQLSLLHTQFPALRRLTMSVNLSGLQFLRAELADQIGLTLREFGLAPASLKLELTESAIIEHAQFAEEMMARLKAQDLRLSLDDFGTGYSSLSSLRRFPIDTVKIDRSFVSTMCEDDDSLEIVRATLTMARQLKMETVAEGIERPQQESLLRELGCEFGQGYHFARPMEGTAIGQFLAAQPPA